MADGADNIGETSDDECCLCGRAWTPTSKGWPLCDTPACPNVVCSSCAAAADLIVSDLFYCPECSGSGTTAAAAAGGAVATAVAACSELEGLPLSHRALRRILRNLVAGPDEPKFRRLRLSNPAVRKYVDLDPVRRILAAVGFVQREEGGVGAGGPSEAAGLGRSSAPPEQVLILEGSVDVGLLTELIEILDGLSPELQGRAAGEDSKDAETAVPSSPAGGAKNDTVCKPQSANADVKRADTEARDCNDKPQAKRQRDR